MDESRGRLASPERRFASYVPLVVVSIAFFASRAIYYWGYNVRFDEYGIEVACQLLDVELLKHDLLRNVFYLHHQVPLWNLVVGAVLKLFPIRHEQGFIAVYCALGYGFAISILSILRSLGVGPISRTLATVAFCISPSVIVYEWWITYHYLGAPLLAMSLASLGVFLRTRKQRWGYASFALLFLVTFARSVFGLSWLLAIVAILLVTRPVPRRLVLRVAAIPILLVFLFTIKTPLQTGRSFGHALLAPNLVLKMLHELPSSTREKLFAEGKLSELSRHDPFVIPSSIPGLAIDLPKTGIPGLDEEKKANGQPNANCLQHIHLGDIYMKDAKFLITHYPKLYLRSVWESISIGFMKSATNVDVLPLTKPFQATVLLQRKFDKLFVPEKTTGRLWVLVFALPLSFFYGILWLIGPKAKLPSSRTQTPMIAVILVTILNVLATTFLSWGDFSRYRFDVDAYFFVLFVLLVQALAARARSLFEAILERARRKRTSDGAAILA